MKRRPTLLFCGFVLLAACGREPPARTVSEFVENPLLLEAAMVRCSQDRSRSKYEAECINARQAVARIQAKEEAEQEKALEAQSERKRKAIRRAQQAAAEARRRAAESERKRREAEYLAQFGVLPSEDAEDPQSAGNVPLAVVPEAPPPDESGVAYDDTVVEFEAAPPPGDAANAPVAETEPPPEAEPPADLSSIRDELRRRNEEDDN